jgi:hypothetical protein
LLAELNLYATIPQQLPPVSTVSVTTHGPNSPVNVGPGTQTQSVTSAAPMAELVQALAALLAAMDNHHPGAAPDLRQVLEDAKLEAEKPTPNVLRLKAFLSGSKDAVQTFAALNPAWDTAQRLAQTLGLL